MLLSLLSPDFSCEVRVGRPGKYDRVGNSTCAEEHVFLRSAQKSKFRLGRLGISIIFHFGPGLGCLAAHHTAVSSSHPPHSHNHSLRPFVPPPRCCKQPPPPQPEGKIP